MFCQACPTAGFDASHAGIWIAFCAINVRASFRCSTGRFGLQSLGHQIHWFGLTKRMPYLVPSRRGCCLWRPQISAKTIWPHDRPLFKLDSERLAIAVIGSKLRQYRLCELRSQRHRESRIQAVEVN